MYRPYKDYTDERLSEELDKTEPTNIGLSLLLLSAGMAIMFYWLRIGFWIATSFIILLFFSAMFDDNKNSKREQLKREISRR
jgi:hypothetical protein